MEPEHHAPSLAELLAEFSATHAWTTLLVMAAITIIGALGGLLLKNVSYKAAGNFLAVPIYLAVIPGISAAMVIAYLIFFTHQNLLTVPGAFAYFVPPVWMGGTLLLLSRIMPFDDVPGFDRLRGLMGLAAVSFFVLLLLDRFRLIVFASVGPLGLLVAFAVLFLAFKVFMSKAFGRREVA